MRITDQETETELQKRVQDLLDDIGDPYFLLELLVSELGIKLNNALTIIEKVTKDKKENNPELFPVPGGLWLKQPHRQCKWCTSHNEKSCSLSLTDLRCKNFMLKDELDCRSCIHGIGYETVCGMGYCMFGPGDADCDYYKEK